MRFVDSYLLGDVVADKNFLIVQKHTVNSLNGSIGSLRGFIVNEPITLRATVLIGGDFARQNITESSKGIMESLRNT